MAATRADTLLTEPSLTLIVAQCRSSRVGPFDLEVAAGRCLVVAGPSGSGKTLLLRLLADLDPGEGRVELDGEDRASMTGPAWRRRVGFVPARSGWWHERIGDHFPPARAGCTQRLARALALPDPLFARDVDHASTGERQRLALLRALLAEPRVLLLDEPTSGLDPVATEAVETVLREAMADGMSLVVVSHDAAQRERLGHATLHVRDGRQVHA